MIVGNRIRQTNSEESVRDFGIELSLGIYTVDELDDAGGALTRSFNVQVMSAGFSLEDFPLHLLFVYECVCRLSTHPIILTI